MPRVGNRVVVSQVVLSAERSLARTRVSQCGLRLPGPSGKPPEQLPRIGMACVALWVSLPGAGEQWAESTRRTLAEDTEWPRSYSGGNQKLIDISGREYPSQFRCRPIGQ